MLPASTALVSCEEDNIKQHAHFWCTNVCKHTNLLQLVHHGTPDPLRTPPWGCNPSPVSDDTSAYETGQHIECCTGSSLYISVGQQPGSAHGTKPGNVESRLSCCRATHAAAALASVQQPLDLA